ncbi:hypothetical protein BH09PLA1_BH09PLA1_16210 [soil metagenome]
MATITTGAPQTADSDPSSFALESEQVQLHLDVPSRKMQDGDTTADETTPAPSINETDRNDVMATIREVFGDGEPRERDGAIRDIARALGYDRVGKNIDQTLDDDLRTAVRRGILQNASGKLSLRNRSATQYTRRADRTAARRDGQHVVAARRRHPHRRPAHRLPPHGFRNQRRLQVRHQRRDPARPLACGR